MSQHYDSTLKHVLEAYAADWVGWLAPRLGLPATTSVEESLDVDLSTVQVIADKAFRLGPPASGLLHIEPQAKLTGIDQREQRSRRRQTWRPFPKTLRTLQGSSASRPLPPPVQNKRR